MDFIRSLWRRWILWHFFRSYDGAIKYTRRKRCKELEKRFPPWYTQTFSEQVRTAPFIFTVRLLCHSFAVWVFFDSDLFSQPVLLCVAFALFVEMILFRGLERWWWQRNSARHYFCSGSVDAARQTLSLFIKVTGSWIFHLLKNSATYKISRAKF